MKTVWVLMHHDQDRDSVVAVYANKERAKEELRRFAASIPPEDSAEEFIVNEEEFFSLEERTVDE